MADMDQVKILKSGVAVWNEWRGKHPTISPDLSEVSLSRANLSAAFLSDADLRGANLSGADLFRADFRGANLSAADCAGANLSEADLSEAFLNCANLSETFLSRADLSQANLGQADLSDAKLFAAVLFRADFGGANLSRADLSTANLLRANLFRANLTEADLSRADLSDANLARANLTEANLSDANLTRTNLKGSELRATNLTGANLSAANLSGAALVGTVLNAAVIKGCRIYGLSVWDVQLAGAIQTDLIITPPDAPAITVDNLGVAQFIYLLLNDQKIGQFIDSISSQIVLILGCFPAGRKLILEALRDALRKRDYLPVFLDFEKSSNHGLAATVSTLARMARFVIADITAARSIVQHLLKIVPELPSLPVRPILLASEHEWGMFRDLRQFPCVLEPFLYEHQDHLLGSLSDKVIGPAETALREQTRKMAAGQ
jgi:uncharacterized protein YjbI with pentapeptide repeats